MKALLSNDPNNEAQKKRNREKALLHRSRKRARLGDSEYLRRQREDCSKRVREKAIKISIVELLKSADFLSRYWSKIEIGHPDACWKWQGAKIPSGYGTIRFNYAQYLTHRVACTIANGEIPVGMYACHRCDNPSYVNPSHLFTGTPSDNFIDAIKKGRR